MTDNASEQPHEHDDSDDHGAPALGGTPDCEAALAEVYSYLDRELTVVEHERVLAHLESCSPCYEAFDFEAELRMVIAAKAQSDEFPEGLRLRIQRRISEIRIVGTDGGSDSDVSGGGA